LFLTTRPFLPTTSLHTCLVFTSANDGKLKQAIIEAINSVFFIFIIPYSSGCGAGGGASLPPNPTDGAGAEKLGVAAGVKLGAGVGAEVEPSDGSADLASATPANFS